MTDVLSFPKFFFLAILLSVSFAQGPEKAEPFLFGLLIIPLVFLALFAFAIVLVGSIVYFFIILPLSRSKRAGFLDKEFLSKFNKASRQAEGKFKDILSNFSELSGPMEYRGLSGFYSDLRLDFFKKQSLTEIFSEFWSIAPGIMFEMILKWFRVFDLSVKTNPEALCFIRGKIDSSLEIVHVAVRLKSADLDLSGQTGNFPGILKIKNKNKPVCTIDIQNRLIFDSNGKKIGSFKLPIVLYRAGGVQLKVTIPVTFGSTTYKLQRIPGVQNLKDIKRLPKLYEKKVDDLNKTQKIALLCVTLLVFLIYRG